MKLLIYLDSLTIMQTPPSVHGSTPSKHLQLIEAPPHTMHDFMEVGRSDADTIAKEVARSRRGTG